MLYLVKEFVPKWRGSSQYLYLIHANNLKEAIQKCNTENSSLDDFDAQLISDAELEVPYFLFERE